MNTANTCSHSMRRLLAGAAAALLLCLSALFAPGAAHAETKKVVYLSTSADAGSGGAFFDYNNYIGVSRDAFKAEAENNGATFESLERVLDSGTPLTDAQKQTITGADVVVIVTLSNSIDTDKFAFIQGLMKKTDPTHPQTFVIASDGCCSVDDNFGAFAKTVAEMGGWSGSSTTASPYREAVSRLNTASPYATSFTQQELKIAYARGITNVPKEFALYLAPNTSVSANGKATAFGVFLPRAETTDSEGNKGVGACVFLLGDSDVIGKRSGNHIPATQPGVLAAALMDSAAGNGNEACACNTGMTELQCGADTGMVLQDNQCVCPDDKPVEVDGVCMPACTEGQAVSAPCACQAPMANENGVCVTPPPICAEGQAISTPCICQAPRADEGGICVTPCTGDKVRQADGTCACPSDRPDEVGGACYAACSGGMEHRADGSCACPSGKENVSGTCLDPCTGGQVRQGDGACACPSGQELQGNACVPVSTQCPAGQELQGNACVPVPTQCPAGQELKGNDCVTIQCPAGQELQANGCAPIQCPDGQELQGNECRPWSAISSTAQCPPGQQREKGKCATVVESQSSSSAPAAGWPALLGLGALLPLLARRRWRKE